MSLPDGREPNQVEFHLKFQFLLRNKMYAIGLMVWDNIGGLPRLWGLTNFTPEQLQQLFLPKGKSRITRQK